jgi:hypothetical protein
LTASYDSSNGTLTVAGPGTVADYQTVLRTVTWTDPAAPELGTRFVTFVATDAVGHSSVASTTTLRSPLLDSLTILIDPFGFHDYGADTGDLDRNALPAKFRATGSITGADPGGTIVATLTDSIGRFPDAFSDWSGSLRPGDAMHWYVDIDLSGYAADSLTTLELQVLFSNVSQSADHSLSIQASVQRS